MSLANFNEMTANLKPSGDGSGMDAINDWWAEGHKVFRNKPEEFQQWSMDNPEMAIRWHARAANKDVNTNWDNKQHHQMAQAISLGLGQSLGMGNDMKENGQMLAFDYDTFKDVNNEWGEGDFWKIGTPQTLDKGFGAFIDNLDLKDVAMMAAPFIAGPLMGPALAGMGLSPAATTAISGALMEGLQGGDLKDMITAGGTDWAMQHLPGILDGVDFEGGFGDGMQLPDWMKDLGEGAKGIYDELGGWISENNPFDGMGDIFGSPEFGGGDWGDTFGDLFGDLGNIFGPGGQQPQQPSPQQQQQMMMMMAQKPEPVELAKMFGTPQIKGPTPMGPWLNPQGMMS